MEDKKQKLFNLISAVYNLNSLNNDKVKQDLLSAAKKIKNNDPYNEIIILVYKSLTKLTADQRINIGEIQQLMNFIKPDYNNLSAKDLRNAEIGYGSLFISSIF